MHCNHSGGVLKLVAVAAVVGLGLGPDLVVGHHEVVVNGPHSRAVAAAELVLLRADKVVGGVVIGPANEGVVAVDYEPINGLVSPLQEHVEVHY